MHTSKDPHAPYKPDYTDDDDDRTMQPLDLSQEQADTDQMHRTTPPDPEITPANRPADWARVISAIFSPLLIPTYCMILAMWLTPLSQNTEATRLGATFMIFLFTAAIPMTYLITVARVGYIKHLDMQIKQHRIAPTLIMIVAAALATYYLYRAKAPDWLIFMMAANGVASVLYFVANFYILISGHAMGMGMLTAALYYIGAHNLGIVAITPWLITIVLTSGLVCSARLALGRHTPLDVAVGYAIGVAAMYGTLHFS